MILDCSNCGFKVEGESVCSYNYYEPEHGPPVRYTLLRCPRCSAPFLVLQEDFGLGWDDPLQLYPADLRVNPALPSPIRQAFGEAIACVKARAFTAAAIMCRKTLEGLCAEHGISESNLVRSLEELKEQGIIEARLFEWADALRMSGNEAAHDLSVSIPSDDARDLLEFTNALLEYVFTFRDKFKQFKARRSETDA
jgi:hypothetical protein